MPGAPVIALWILLAHWAGDYVLQTDWMAQEKTSRWGPAIVHGICYTLPYALITHSPWALLIIGGTHILIDRFRLAKHITWVKNQIAPSTYRYSWAEARNNAGFSKDKPVWMSTWLMIIVDNGLHILINTVAILTFGSTVSML